MRKLSSEDCLYEDAFLGGGGAVCVRRSVYLYLTSFLRGLVSLYEDARGRERRGERRGPSHNQRAWAAQLPCLGDTAAQALCIAESRDGSKIASHLGLSHCPWEPFAAKRMSYEQDLQVGA